MDNQILKKNLPEHNEATKTSEMYNKKPADYLQPVKSCEVQVGKASSLETQTKADAFNKSEEVAVHVHVSGNPQNTVQIWPQTASSLSIGVVHLTKKHS